MTDGQASWAWSEFDTTSSCTALQTPVAVSTKLACVRMKRRRASAAFASTPALSGAQSLTAHLSQLPRTRRDSFSHAVVWDQ